MNQGYGFAEAMQAAEAPDLPPVEPKRVPRHVREEGRAVAAEAGFHSHAPVHSPATEPVARAVGRVRLNEAAPRRGLRFQGEARVQLNIQAPVPVAEAWRALADVAPVGQWELMEAAVPLLRRHFGLDEPR